jgi:hypothetical protein
MNTDHAQKLTPDEMKALVASYTGEIRKIPENKRALRKPKQSKSSEGRQADWSRGLDRYTWGG